jgi:carboxyl-terminal processing protease
VRRSGIALPVVLLAVVTFALTARFADRLPDWLTGDGDAQVVAEAVDRVHDIYYRAVPEQTLADKAIAGMVESLGDRFSSYLPPKEYQRFKQATDSAYEGVGMQIQEDKRGLRVVTVYDGSPAKRAGIRRGDVVTKANGVSLAGKDATRGSALIKGPPGTEVTLTWVRGKRTFTRKVSRARVTVPVVAASLRRAPDGTKVGVVRLAAFTSGAHAEVRQALEKLKKRGAKAYVLDLRANGGGLVTEAQLVASAFLRGGPVVKTKGRAVPERTFDATGDPVVPTAPVAVLVDHDTASASEIVSGALQDRKRAKVVGTRTFGKGVFQSVVELSNGGALDITAGQYFTPSGRNLGGRGVHTGAGIAPDVPAKDDPKTPRDEALPVAVRTAAAGAK